MSNTIEHLSRTRIGDATLQVVADSRQGLDRLIGTEEDVVRRYAAQGNWPHKHINVFVLENLTPLVAQIKRATAVSTVIAEDVDRRPMINVYDAGDLSECAIFVNRGRLKHDGMWDDLLTLCALLAHEHAHPLSENATVQNARRLSLQTSCDGGVSKAAVEKILHLLAEYVCLHAPQEVFANEVAIRAGFARALLHLDRDTIAKARLGIGKRPSLVRSFNKQVADGKLGAQEVAGLLLIGDLQAYIGFALETAGFMRAGDDRAARALDAALSDTLWPHLDAATKDLYDKLCSHYRHLKGDLGLEETRAWVNEALGFLSEALRQRHFQVRFDVSPGGRAAAKHSNKIAKQAKRQTPHGAYGEPARGSP
jgi:hypothetical protein